MKYRNTPGAVAGRWARYVGLLLILLGILGPYIVMIITSITPKAELAAAGEPLAEDRHGLIFGTGSPWSETASVARPGPTVRTPANRTDTATACEHPDEGTQCQQEQDREQRKVRSGAEAHVKRGQDRRCGEHDHHATRSRRRIHRPAR